MPLTVDATLFAGPGEMSARCRAFDWASTPLGPTSGWSLSLRTMADVVLASRNPMLLFWGPELVQLYNDAFRPSLGASTGPHARHPRALGMRAAEFWTDVWAVVGPQVEGVMTRGEAVWFENLHLPIERGGKLEDAWWTYSYSPVRDDDRRINGTLVVSLETTATVRATEALKAERAKYATLVEGMADNYIELDQNFRIVAVNSSTERTLGRSRSELVNRTVRDALPATANSAWESDYRRVISEGVDLHFTRSYRDARVSLVIDVDMYPTSNGGLAAFWRDVTGRERAKTERARLLAEARDARRAAEAANRGKSDFLAVMSHDLRTPLNAIGGYAELIEDGIHGPVTQEQRTALGRIRSSQRHLLGLINGLLDYAKIDAGAVQYSTEDVSLDEVLVTCEALVAPQARSKSLDLKRSRCEHAVVARADREKTQQVVVNLLGNAVKFTETGWISLACARNGDGTVSVRIADSGRGVAADRLETIFKPFVRVESESDPEQEGVGLGLAISHDLARGMGGDLTVESTVGVGSTFMLTLPEAT